MSNSQWIDGPCEAALVVWVDHNGKAQVDPLAFSMLDGAGQQEILARAAQLETEFAQRPARETQKPNSLTLAEVTCPDKAANLVSAADDLIAAHLRFVNALGEFRDEIRHFPVQAISEAPS